MMKKSILVAVVVVFSGVTQFDSTEAAGPKAAPAAQKAAAAAQKAAAAQGNGQPGTPEQHLSAADNNLIITIDNTLKGMGQNIGDLGHQKGALAAALETFLKEHNETLDKLNNLTTQHQDLDKKHNDLTTQHQDLDKKHNDLTTQLQDLNKKHNDLTTQHQDLNGRHDDLTTQHQDLNKKHDDLTAQHADLQENHRVLRENYDALQEDNEDMKEAVAVANGQVAQSDVERRATINIQNEVKTHFLDAEKIYLEVKAEAEKPKTNVAILKGAIARMAPIFEILGKAFRAGQK
ncbi:MAG: hypothetical protein LBJ96_02855 [Holosporaceae bacterium]|jgi:chromosome segregation ATPase|nr:hypothetical protein [Holosporaceae bacterium]